MCLLEVVGLLYTLTIVCQLPIPLDSVVPNLKYSKKDLHLLEGETMELKCVTEYQPRNCTELSVFWCRMKSDESDANPEADCEFGSELDRQLITMNETDSSEDATIRRRDVILKVANITYKDEGSFQCRASCSSGGLETAVGHFVTLKTHAPTTSIGIKPSSNCGTHQPNIMVWVLAIGHMLCLWPELKCVL